MATPAKKKRRAKGDGGLHKRSNGLWVARINLGRDPITGRPLIREVTSMDRSTCLDKRDKLIEDIEAGVDPMAPRQTVKTYLTYWIDNVAKKRVAPGTLTTYRAAVTKHITPAIGHHRLDLLRPPHILAMLATVEKKGLSTRTAQSVYAVLSVALEDAVRSGLIRNNPAKRMPKPTADSADRGHLNAAGFRTLVQHIPTKPADQASRISTALFTGGRQAECIGLEWDRIDWTNKVLDLSWTLKRIKLKPDFDRRGVGDVYPKSAFDVGRADYQYRPIWRGVCLTQPKTEKSRRIVPMIAPLEAALRQWWIECGQPTTGLVWTRTDGTPLIPQDDTDLWKNTLRDIGLVDDTGEPLTLHAARHTLATLLLEAGVPEDVRMQIVGHSSVAAQRIYAHVDQTVTRAALGQLTKILDT